MTTNIKQEIQSLSFKIAMISDAKRALAAELAVLDAELASHISKRLHLLREGFNETLEEKV
jgi:hypothetical protein